MAKIRLDQFLARSGLAETRARARDSILRGCVSVDGRVVSKPGELVDEAACVETIDPAARYVSRAALKLVAALDAFAMDVGGRACLDIGASTGGFTQVLLERGARHVTAVDVGHDQLHATLRHDPRVTALEGLNARDLAAAHLAEPPEVIVSDVSFISLRLALPPALALAADAAIGAFLVKPQFEAGRAAIGKGGLVDPAIGRQAAEGVRDWLAGQPGWTVTGFIPSPIAGGDGNLEYLVGVRRG